MNDTLEIHNVDVGQGDCTFIAIKCDNRCKQSKQACIFSQNCMSIDNQNRIIYTGIKYLILLDGGKSNNYVEIFNYWNRNFSRKKIDSVVISHWDEDHYMGIITLLFSEVNNELVRDENSLKMFSENFNTYYPDEKFEDINSQYIKNFFRNRRISLFPSDKIMNNSENIEITCFAIDGRTTSFRVNENQSSIALLIKTYGFRYYTGGDLDNVRENRLINNLEESGFKLNGFKVSHHGSNTSTTQQFLNATNPDYAIISHGNGNFNGIYHPTADTLTRLNSCLTFLTNYINTGNKEDDIWNNNNNLIFAGTRNNRNGHIKQAISPNGKLLITVGLTREQSNKLSNGSHFSFGCFDYKNYFIMMENYARRSIPSTLRSGPNTSQLQLIEAKLKSLSGVLEENNQIKIANYSVNNKLNLSNAVFSFNEEKSCFDAESDLKIEDVNVTLQGTINEKEILSLKNVDNDIKVPILEMIKLLSNSTLTNYFPEFISDLFGNITLSSIEIIHNIGNESGLNIEAKLNLKDELSFTENIKLKDSSIYLDSSYSYIGNKEVSVFNTTLQSVFEAGSKKYNVAMDFSNNATWELKINPENLTFADVAQIIPGFDSESIDEWSSTLGLNNIIIAGTQIGLNLSSQDKFQFLSLNLKVNFVEDYNLLLNTMYRKNEGINIYGSLDKNINTRKLLTCFGVSEKHAEKFPDMEIYDFGFNANPQNKNYMINAGINNMEEAISFKLGDMEIAVNSIVFKVEKTISDTSIKVILSGIFAGATVAIETTYDKSKGFVFRGKMDKINTKLLFDLIDVNLPDELISANLENLQIVSEPFEISSDTNLSLKKEINGSDVELKINSFSYDKTNGYDFSGEITIFSIDATFAFKKSGINIYIEKLEFAEVLKSFGVKEIIANIFKLELNNINIVMSAKRFEISDDISEITLCDGFELKNNKLELISYDKNLSIKIFTKLDFNFSNNKIICEGGLELYKDSLSFFAKSESQITNVFGIKDFNFGELYVSLNNNIDGIGIGFMGDIRFRKLSGQIALYLSTVNPVDKLLVLNLNSLTLYDIMDSFVDVDSSGIKDILDSIGIKPITLMENSIAQPDLSNEIKSEIKNNDTNATGNYELKSYEDYTWLQSNSYLIEDKANFKSYSLIKKANDKNFSLVKNVRLYGCTSDQPINLNGRIFQPGFAFSGELNFLGIKQTVDFSAMPKKGLKLKTAMDKSINLGGNILCLCRVEDSKKGPILDLSTYPENRHFYLSAKLTIFDIFNFEARVLFENNQFAFMLTQNLLGFSATIKAMGSFANLKEAAFALEIAFTSNGFGAITQEVSKQLHKVADNINRKTKEIENKFTNAQRVLNEYNRNIMNVKNKIKSKEKRLRKLKRTHYPWHKAYKYAALGAKILLVAGEITALTTYKLTQIGLLKAAKGILEVAKKAVATIGTLGAGIIDGVANVVEAVGKGIDWLIKINRVSAQLALSNSKKLFDFDFDFHLCGSHHVVNFELEFDGSLKDALLNEINGLINSKRSVSETENLLKLNEIYGELDLETEIYNDESKLSSIKLELEKSFENNERYQKIIFEQDAKKNIDYLMKKFDYSNSDETKINIDCSKYTNDLDNQSIDEIIQSASEMDITMNDSEKFNEVNENTLMAIQTLGNNLIESVNSLTITEENRESVEKVKKLIDEMPVIGLKKEMSNKETKTTIFKNSSDIIESLTNNVSLIISETNQAKGENKEEIEIENLSVEAKEEIISKYEELVSEDTLHPYYKMIFLRNLSTAYKEVGKTTKADDCLKNSSEIAKDLFGENSDEYIISKEWHSIIKE